MHLGQSEEQPEAARKTAREQSRNSYISSSGFSAIMLNSLPGNETDKTVLSNQFLLHK